MASTVGRKGGMHVLPAPFEGTLGEVFVEYWNNAEVGQTLANVIPVAR